jgi:hypothetical protein
MDQRLARLDELIVGHVERHHPAGNLRRNRDGASVRIGVVGALDAGGGLLVLEPA